MNRTRIITLTIAGLLFVAAINFAVQYFTTGKLTVNTPEKDSQITVQLHASKDEPIKSKGKSRTFRLAPGTYLITAESQGRVTAALREIKPRQTTPVNLIYRLPLESVTVANTPAANIQQQGQTLLFENVFSRKLNQIAPNQSDPQPYANEVDNIANIKWYTGNRALITTTKGELLLLSGGKAQPIRTETAASTFNPVTGEVLYALGRKVFKVTPPSLNPTQVYEADGIFSGMSAFGDFLVLYNTSSEVDDDTAKDKYIAPTLLNLKTASGSILDFSPRDAVWSSNGKFIALMDDTRIGIYDLASRRISGFTASNGVGLSWLTPESITYGYGNDVWEYNISQLVSYKLSNKPAQTTPNSISTTPEGAIYYTTYLNDAEATIYTLASAKEAAAISKLSGSLPYETRSYLISFVAIPGSKPVISITSYVPINRPEQAQYFRNEITSSRQAALTYLKEEGINPADYTIKYTPEI